MRPGTRATAVRCPFCKAGPGRPCRVGSKTKTGFWHPARTDAARILASRTEEST